MHQPEKGREGGSKREGGVGRAPAEGAVVTGRSKGEEMNKRINSVSERLKHLWILVSIKL